MVHGSCNEIQFMEFTEQEKTTQERAKKYIIDKKDDLIKSLFWIKSRFK